MPNAIKYNVSTETLALKKGNFWIGTGDVGKGPTSSTGFYNGITPPSGGYTIYLNKASEGPSIYTTTTDAELISLTNKIAGTNYSTIDECLTYYTTQNDKMILNIDYPPIVTDSLAVNLDPGFTPSYPKSGVGVYNLGSNSAYTYTLSNGVGYSSDAGGVFSFDGADDVIITNKTYTLSAEMSWDVWFKRTLDTNTFNMIFANNVPFLAFRGAASGSVANKFLASWYSVLSGVNTQRTLYTPQTYNDNTWYNVTFTLFFDSVNQLTTGKIYVNGVFIISAEYPSESLPSTTYLRIGNYNSSQYPFAGNIGKFTIYNKVLNSSEVLQNYQTMLPRVLGENIVTSGLVGYWDAGYTTSYPTTGTSWFNVAGTSGGTGTLINGPTYNSSDGGSLIFDGVDDVCNFPVNTFNSGSPQDGTYYFRIKYPTYTSTQTILFNENGGGFGSGIVYYYNPGTTGRYYFVIYFNNTSAGTGNILGIFDGLTAGSWFDVAITFDSTGKWVTYKNGVANTSGTAANFSSWRRTGNSTPVFKPASSLGSGNSQLFYYYNRALSASEILQIFNATKSRIGL